MPIPSSINDLSTAAASNSPSGAEDLGTADDYFRVYASYIAALRDVVLAGTANLSTANVTYTGTLTGGTGVVNIGSGQFYKSASGNIGIGTTAPNSNGPTYSNIELRGTAGGGGYFYAGDNAARSKIGYSVAGGGTLVFSINTDPLLFGVNDIERMRIKSTGQINLTGIAGAPAGAAGDIYYDSVTNKHYGHNGTSWNALY